jgi:hypothetical protein
MAEPRRAEPRLGGPGRIRDDIAYLSRKPCGLIANIARALLAYERASQPVEMSRYRVPVVKIAGRDLEHIVVPGAELLANPSVAVSGGGVSVDVRDRLRSERRGTRVPRGSDG